MREGGKEVEREGGGKPINCVCVWAVEVWGGREGKERAEGGSGGVSAIRTVNCQCVTSAATIKMTSLTDSVT